MSEAAVPLSGRGIKPLVSLLAHRRAALIAALVVIAAGIPFAWIKGKAHYQAEAVIQVAPHVMKNLSEDREQEMPSNTQYRQFVEQQARSFSRYDIAESALKLLGDKRSLWVLPQENERHAIERLKGDIKVAAIPDTYMLRVTLEGEKKEGLAEVVNAMVETFVDKMRDETLFGSDQRTANLREREDEVLKLIAAKGQRRAEIARLLSLTTFSEGTSNPYDKLVSDQRNRVLDAHQKRFDADAALAAFQGSGETNTTMRSVQDAALNDPGLNTLKGGMLKRRVDLLQQISGLKPDHPAVGPAIRELAEIDTELSGQLKKFEGDVRGNLLMRLKSTADQAHQVEKQLTEELNALEARATEFALLFQEAQTLTSEINQSRGETDKLRERINFIRTERNAIGWVRPITAALAPEIPFGTGRKKLLIMVLAAALLAAVVVPVAIDLLDKRIRTANDAEKLMGIPLAGWQIERHGTAERLFGDEQLRRIAASMMRSRKSRNSGIFGMTGVRPGAGTTTLLFEIARTLRELGFKVLVVEANGFERDRRFKTARPGLMELLRGQARSPEVIAPAEGDLAPRVGFGGQGRVSIERLDRLTAALNHWAGIADFVLVDLPPLLTSADAELLVPCVGQVMLVVQAGVITKGELGRARRLLQTLDPDAVGLVVNRIQPFAGGGYMSDLMLEAVTGRRADQIEMPSLWQRWAAHWLSRPRHRQPAETN
jgi:Mrp family chromosome partitioning ATPase/capsular polysaccharide biosynthesis protein